MVRFVIEATNKQAMTSLGEVNKDVANLSGQLNGSLKSAMAGAFSIIAIGEAIKSTIEFGDTIDKAANNLGITTQYMQILKRVARDTGKEFGLMEKAINDVADAAQNALNGDKSKKNAFGLLGVNEKDLRTLNKQDLVTKTAQGALKLPKEQALAALTDIYGKKVAPTLLGQASQLANPEGVRAKLQGASQLMSDEDIARMVEIKDKFEDLADTMKVRVAPGISWLLDKLDGFINGMVDIAELIGTGLGALSTVIQDFDIVGLITAFGENLVNTTKAVFDNAWALITGKKSLGEVVASVGQQLNANDQNLVNKTFGKSHVASIDQAIQDKLAEQAERDRQRERDREERDTARKDAQKALTKSVNRTPEADNVKPFQNDFAGVGGDSGRNLSVGGTSQINLQYRIERLNQSMLETLKEIAKLIAEGNAKTNQGAFPP